MKNSKTLGLGGRKNILCMKALPLPCIQRIVQQKPLVNSALKNLAFAVVYKKAMQAKTSATGFVKNALKTLQICLNSG